MAKNKQPKINTKEFDPKEYVEENPILESFVDDVFEASDEIFSDDYTYEDLLFAVVDDDYDYFEDIIGAPCKDLFDYIKREVELAETEEDENLDEAVLTVAQRRKRAMTMRRMKGRMKIARARAARRRATPEKLKQRARKKARAILKKRFTQKRDYGSMSPTEKMQVDKRLERISPAVIDRIAKRQLPAVRKAEVERLARRSQKKNESFENVSDLIESISDINVLFESKFK